VFSDFPEQAAVAQLLQRSLERDRLAHGYLFIGHSLAELESMAAALAKALNCQNPPHRAPNGIGLESCDACDSCQRIQRGNHPDVLWVRPESKSRIITIEQMRDLMQTVNLKPGAAEFKVAVIVAADRLNPQAANAFLKTLEEPPAHSILILLTTEPQRVLETIVSRCLRLTFAGEGARFTPAESAWLAGFSAAAAQGTRSLLGRYRLLGLLLKKLTELRADIEKNLAARSPLEVYEDLDPKMRDKLEEELSAAIEAEYRRQRTDLVGALHWWLRDIWLQTVNAAGLALSFPELADATHAVAQRIAAEDARQNLEHLDRLQRQLHSNVQEALALEVGLLKLKL
jgi:DNA polymerase-3 subunit delta'